MPSASRTSACAAAEVRMRYAATYARDGVVTVSAIPRTHACVSSTSFIPADFGVIDTNLDRCAKGRELLQLSVGRCR